MRSPVVNWFPWSSKCSKTTVITAITWFNIPSFEMNAKFENILKVSIENLV